MTNVPDPKRPGAPADSAPVDAPLQLDLPPARPPSLAAERFAGDLKNGDDEPDRADRGLPTRGQAARTPRGAGQANGRGGSGEALGARLAHAFTVLARLLVRLSRFGFSKARQHGGKAISDFNHRPEAIRWRAYAFGSYGALCALTFAAQLWEPNSLNAYLKVTPVALPESTVIFVRNDSKTSWKDVKLVLNGIYSYERSELTPGSHVLIQVDRFAVFDANGKASYAPKGVPLKTLVIDCDRGHFEKELAK